MNMQFPLWICSFQYEYAVTPSGSCIYQDIKVSMITFVLLYGNRRVNMPLHRHGSHDVNWRVLWIRSARLLDFAENTCLSFTCFSLHHFIMWYCCWQSSKQWGESTVKNCNSTPPPPQHCYSTPASRFHFIWRILSLHCYSSVHTSGACNFIYQSKIWRIGYTTGHFSVGFYCCHKT